MRSMSLRLLMSVLVALGLGAAVPAQVACACSCAEVGTAEALRNASAVFEGDVVSLTQPSTGSSDEPIAYTVAVTTVYKGSLPATVVVRYAAHQQHIESLLAEGCQDIFIVCRVHHHLAAAVHESRQLIQEIQAVHIRQLDIQEEHIGLVPVYHRQAVKPTERASQHLHIVFRFQ